MLRMGCCLVLRARARMYKAQNEGAGGFLEALQHLQLISSSLVEDTLAENSFGNFDLIAVCHRLPFKERKLKDGTVKKRNQKS